MNKKVFFVALDKPFRDFNLSSNVLYIIYYNFRTLASYILLFSVNLFMDFYKSVFMSIIWWNLLRPMYAMCHIAITASTLLLTSATFER